MDILPCQLCGCEIILNYGEFYDHPFTCQLVFKNISPWISVKDRLPEKDGRYLVIEDHHSRWIGIDKFQDGKFTMKVTHWMTLPKLQEVK